MWNQTLRIIVCVGAFAAASAGVGIGSVPMSGVSIFGGPLIGVSGPFTQQQAGRRSRSRRIEAVVVTMAIGFQGTEREDICKAELSQRVPGEFLIGAFSRSAPHPAFGHLLPI
jgi:hypothetical protein